MQSLYAYFSTKENNMPAAEKSMLKHIKEVVELNLVILSLLVELVKYADNFFEDGKKKHLPTEADLNPNRRFVENKVIALIREDQALMDKIAKVSGIWLKNDHNVIRKLFKQLLQSDLYKNYIANDDNTIKVDQRFFVNALNDFPNLEIFSIILGGIVIIAQLQLFACI